MSQVRAAVYARISVDPTETKLGVQRQEKDCRQLAKQRGWQVTEVFVDNDVSATKAKVRPAYRDLLAGISQGRFDAVVVYDLDRLHRRPIELEEFVAVCDRAGVTQLASVGGDIDLGTGEGMLVARIKGAVAAEEARKVRERTKRKKREMAERGVPAGGGRRAFGYTANGAEVVPVEAETVRWAAERLLKGASMASISRHLNEHGPEPVGGGIWRGNAIRKFLTSPRTAGLRQHQGNVVGPATWEPLLDRDTWEQVRHILADPARRKNAGARRYLLTGLVYCGRSDLEGDGCGNRLTGTLRRGHPSMLCSLSNHGCGRRQIRSLPLEADVLAAFFALVPSMTIRPVEKLPLEEVATAEAKLIELGRDYDDGLIGRAEWLQRRDLAQQRLEVAQSRLALVSRNLTQPLPADVEKKWETFTFDEQRAFLARAVDRVEVGPAALREDRVRIHWRA